MYVSMRVTCLHLLGLLLFWLGMSQSVWATILVVSGGTQTVAAGTIPTDVTFKVVDVVASPTTIVPTPSATVNFSLIDPLGKPVGLITPAGITDNNGLVLCRLNALSGVGSYTLTATLAKDATQLVNTNIIVIAGAPGTLTVTDGSKQNVQSLAVSNSIVFKLTDSFGNSVTSKMLNFSVVTPGGLVVTTGLNPLVANTNDKGEASTRFTAPTISGNYTIVAKLASDERIASSTTLFVTEPVPSDLPSLGAGGSIDATGKVSSSTALFNGGVSVGGALFNQEVVQRLSDTVVIKGFFSVEGGHIGQLADILIVAGYTPLPLSKNKETFYMLDSSGNVLPWNMAMFSLVPFTRAVTLTPSYTVNMYSGRFIATGLLRVFYGYRLSGGTVVFNANQPISILINP